MSSKKPDEGKSNPLATGCGGLIGAVFLFPWLWIPVAIVVGSLNAIGIINLDRVAENQVVFWGTVVFGLTLFVWLSADSKNKELSDAEEKRRRDEELYRKRAEYREQDRIREEWEQTEEGKSYRRQCQEEEEKRRRERDFPIARIRWERYYKYRAIEELPSMSGLEFEEFIASLLFKIGFSDVLLTPINDQGADILCISPDRFRTAIQTKRWKNRLGNGAVQEILGAITYYQCERGMVITNADYTDSAKALAARDPRIQLCDGQWLARMIKDHLPREIPPFDWLVHDRLLAEGRFKLFNHQLMSQGIGGMTIKSEILAQLAAGTIRVEEATRILAEL